mmetsp:Transcript_103239/g.331021  ORF Transcript_103239/g.331021 Transcript_103239/m.331021 type:complete len:202 (+) Transcript_103239:256-861(+)
MQPRTARDCRRPRTSTRRLHPRCTSISAPLHPPRNRRRCRLAPPRPRSARPHAAGPPSSSAARSPAGLSMATRHPPAVTTPVPGPASPGARPLRQPSRTQQQRSWRHLLQQGRQPVVARPMQARPVRAVCRRCAAQRWPTVLLQRTRMRTPAWRRPGRSRSPCTRHGNSARRKQCCLDPKERFPLLSSAACLPTCHSPKCP